MPFVKIISTVKLAVKFIFFSVPFLLFFWPLSIYFPIFTPFWGTVFHFCQKRNGWIHREHGWRIFNIQNWVSGTRIFKEMLCSNRSVYLLGGHECSWSICWLGDYTHINSANTIKKDSQILWHLTVSSLTDISKSSLRSEDREVGIFDYSWRKYR